MNTLLYRCFLVAAEEMNFTRAAKRMFISQQTLSHHISRLEEEYGVSLFERGKPLKLTYAGQKMLILSQQIINLERQVRNEMGEVSNEVKGELSIGVGRDRLYLLSSVMPLFHQVFPNYIVHFIGGFHQQLVQLLIANQIDMMISSTPQALIDLESQELMDDYLVLCIRDDLLQKYCGEIFQSVTSHEFEVKDFHVFKDCPFAMASDNVKSRIMAESFFRTISFDPEITATVDYSEGLLSLALSGLCATICFYKPLKNRLQQIDSSISSHIYLIHADGLSNKVKVQATWVKDRYHSNALSYFRQLLISQI